MHSTSGKFYRAFRQAQSEKLVASRENLLNLHNPSCSSRLGPLLCGAVSKLKSGLNHLRYSALRVERGGGEEELECIMGQSDAFLYVGVDYRVTPENLPRPPSTG